MAVAARKANLDLTPGKSLEVINVNQYDNIAGGLELYLYFDHTEFTPPSGSSARIQGTKPDKLGFNYTASISGNKITADLKEQMTVVAGDVPTEIQITNGSNKIYTANFILRVEPAAMADDTKISNSDLGDVRRLLEIAESLDDYDMSVYAKKTDLTDYAKKSDLSAYGKKAEIAAVTLLAANWNGNSYSLATLYPAATYDLSIDLNGDSITLEQYEAFSGAMIAGSVTTNTLKALGDVPEVDIPVIVKAVEK